MTKIKWTAMADDEGGYLTLPDHPAITGGEVSGCVAETVRLADLAPHLKGPDIMLDVDTAGRVIGIEVLLDDEEEA